jgi:hypothetical protein
MPGSVASGTPCIIPNICVAHIELLLNGVNTAAKTAFTTRRH